MLYRRSDMLKEISKKYTPKLNYAAEQMLSIEYPPDEQDKILHEILLIAYARRIGKVGHYSYEFNSKLAELITNLVIYCENSSYFWTLSGMLKPFPSRGFRFRVSGFRPALGFSPLTPDT
jgi:hypothetical protein